MKTNIQFHAKSKEIADFLNKIISENNIRAYGVVLFPQYYAAEITKSITDDLNDYYFIILSKSELRINTEMEYDQYLNRKNGDLIISPGADDGMELGESAMGVVSNGGIDSLWKRIINQFKSDLLKGAYAVNPNGKREYYPNHWYTQGAKTAWKNGIIIRPAAGWNHYELENCCVF